MPLGPGLPAGLEGAEASVPRWVPSPFESDESRVEPKRKCRGKATRLHALQELAAAVDPDPAALVRHAQRSLRAAVVRGRRGGGGIWGTAALARIELGAGHQNTRNTPSTAVTARGRTDISQLPPHLWLHVEVPAQEQAAVTNLSHGPLLRAACSACTASSAAHKQQAGRAQWPMPLATHFWEGISIWAPRMLRSAAAMAEPASPPAETEMGALPGTSECALPAGARP